MTEQFKYGVQPSFFGTEKHERNWHVNSFDAADDVLKCFDLGADEVNIKIVKKGADNG